MRSAHQETAAGQAETQLLIADDDESIRELLREFLQDLGYQVETVANGAEALEWVQRRRPSAILMDLMMPRLSGADATTALKSNPETADIPVVAMSAGRNLAAMATGIPADGFVSKPFDFDALTAAISYHLKRRARQNTGNSPNE